MCTVEPAGNVEGTSLCSFGDWLVPKPGPVGPKPDLMIPKTGPGETKPGPGGPRKGPGGPNRRRNCFTSSNSSLSPGVDQVLKYFSFFFRSLLATDKGTPRHSNTWQWEGSRFLARLLLWKTRFSSACPCWSFLRICVVQTTADYECDGLVTHPGCVPSRQQNLLDPDQEQWFTDGWAEFHCLEKCRDPLFSHDILTFLTVQHLQMCWHPQQWLGCFWDRLQQLPSHPIKCLNQPTFE